MYTDISREELCVQVCHIKAIPTAVIASEDRVRQFDIAEGELYKRARIVQDEEAELKLFSLDFKKIPNSIRDQCSE